MRLALPKAILDSDNGNPVLKLEHLMNAVDDVHDHEKVGTDISKRNESSRAALKALGVKIKNEENNKEV